MDGTRDPSDFEGWARENWSRLLGLARVVAGDPSLADDVLQDCLVDLYRRWDTVTGEGSRPLAYAARIMGSKAANHRRTAWARRVSTTDDAAFLDATGGNDTESVDNRLLVSAALQGLNARQRQIVALHYLLDMPVAEIAASLGCPLGSVTSDLTRARQRLRGDFRAGGADVRG